MGFEVSDEGRLRFASCERRRCGTVGIRGRIGPDRDTGIGGQALANFIAPFVVRRTWKQAAPLASEGQRIRDRLRLLTAARLDSAAERSPFKLQPVPAFERIEMLVIAVVIVSLHELQLELNAVEQPV